jgi:hypothetical protein
LAIAKPTSIGESAFGEIARVLKRGRPGSDRKLLGRKPMTTSAFPPIETLVDGGVAFRPGRDSQS